MTGLALIGGSVLFGLLMSFVVWRMAWDAGWNDGWLDHSDGYTHPGERPRPWFERLLSASPPSETP